MKKYLVFVVTLAALVGLYACGGGGGGTSPDEIYQGGTGGTNLPGGSTNPAANITLTSSVTSTLSQGGETTISAVVTDENGRSVANGTVVTFVATAGTITTSAATLNGAASATYQASAAGGNVTITASTANGVSKSLTIQVATGDAASVTLGGISPATIGVLGSGRDEISTLRFNVKDGSGNPVSDGQLVNFQIATPLGGGEKLSTVSGKTVGGEVAVALQSGSVSGTVGVIGKVKISKAGEPDQFVSTEGRVTIVGGLPDAEHFSLAAQFLNVAGGVTFGLKNNITAYLGDRYGNVVPDDTPVSFISECGTIGGGTGFTTTTNFGVASAVLQTSNPTAPNLDGVAPKSLNKGLCTIVAYTPGRESFNDKNGNGIFDDGDECNDLSEPYIDTNDNDQRDEGEKYIDINNDEIFNLTDGQCSNTMIWTKMKVLISDDVGEINLIPTTFSIKKGESQEFTISFKDQNGNALTAGTKLKVTTTAGTLTGTTEIIQADTNEEGAVYKFTLHSDLEDSATRKLAEIRVEIISAGSVTQGNNGATRFATASGTINNP